MRCKRQRQVTVCCFPLRRRHRDVLFKNTLPVEAVANAQLSELWPEQKAAAPGTVNLGSHPSHPKLHDAPALSNIPVITDWNDSAISEPELRDTFSVYVKGVLLSSISGYTLQLPDL